jgi:hypothetical protein
MADIDLERKQGPPAWLWVLGLLVLAGIVWWIVAPAATDRTAMEADPATFPTPPTPVEQPATVTLPSAAQAFLQECRFADGAGTGQMGSHHEFTARCFEHLADAIEGVATELAGEADLRADLQSVRQNARRIREADPPAPDLTRWTLEAAEAGADALQTLHQRWQPGDAQFQSAIDQVQESARQIDPAELLIDQMDSLHDYFRDAGEALERMGEGQTV